MDSIFPNFCSVCDKTLGEFSSGLYCSEACRLHDSHPKRPVYLRSQSSHDELHHGHSHSHSPPSGYARNGKQPVLALQYPSVFTPHSYKSPAIRLEDHFVPRSIPDLSVSEDEESVIDDEYDIPHLSLENDYFMHH